MISDKWAGAQQPEKSRSDELLELYEYWERELVWLARQELAKTDDTYRLLWDRFDLAYHALLRYGAGCAVAAEEKLALEFPTILKKLMDYHALYLYRSGFRSFFQLYSQMTLERLQEQQRGKRRWR